MAWLAFNEMFYAGLRDGKAATSSAAYEARRCVGYKRMFRKSGISPAGFSEEGWILT